MIPERTKRNWISHWVCVNCGEDYGRCFTPRPVCVYCGAFDHFTGLQEVTAYRDGAWLVISERAESPHDRVIFNQQAENEYQEFLEKFRTSDITVRNSMYIFLGLLAGAGLILLLAWLHA